MTKISISLPDYRVNGLDAIEDDLVDDPDTVHLVIGFIDVRSLKIDRKLGVTIPTVQLRSVEVVQDPDDRALAGRLMQRAHESRTGLVAFRGAVHDPDTGEARP